MPLTRGSICSMSQKIEIHYWETDKNTISLQVVAEKSELEYIRRIFKKSKILASGRDYSKNKEILIYRKSFKNYQNMLDFLSQLTHQKINLKEVK